MTTHSDAVQQALDTFNDEGYRLAVLPESNYEQGIAQGWVPARWSYSRWVWENAYSEARANAAAGKAAAEEGPLDSFYSSPY